MKTLTDFLSCLSSQLIDKVAGGCAAAQVNTLSSLAVGMCILYRMCSGGTFRLCLLKQLVVERFGAHVQEAVVLVGGAYADARRALQPGAPPLDWPAGWRALENCTVLEVHSCHRACNASHHPAAACMPLAYGCLAAGL